MPWTVIQDGNQFCVIRKDTRKRVPGGCHPTKAEAERHMRAILANYHGGGNMSAERMWLDVEQMRDLCPGCAEEMERKGWDRIDILAVLRESEDYAVGVGGDFPGGMPRQLAQGLCKKIGSDPGFFTNCMNSNIRLPQGWDRKGFCAELHKYCVGKWPAQHKTSYVMDEFVAVHPGQPYRLLRIGKLVKDGKERILDLEFLKKFKLPHFKPPIKAGSHEEATPAGGHIVGLEVREDGLYAIPELNDRGAQAFNEGQYRYHSPEIVWDGGLEDPETGEIISGPLIVGDALLHTPHLGEAAALYTYKPILEVDMSESVQIPESLWERILAALNIGKAEIEPPQEPEIPEEMIAAVAERDELKAKLEEIEKQGALRERVEKFEAELKEIKVPEGTAEKLAAMNDEHADWVVEQFKAFAEQIKTGKLTGEIGSTGSGEENPKEALDAAVKAVMSEKKVDYNAALEVVREEHPELIEAAYLKRGE